MVQPWLQRSDHEREAASDVGVSCESRYLKLRLNRTDSLQRKASNALNQNNASPPRVNQTLANHIVLESPELLRFRSIFDYRESAIWKPLSGSIW